jgi:hypothetical protein
MYVAKSQGMEAARLTNFDRSRHRVIGVHRTLVRTFRRLTVSGKVELAYMVAEPVPLGVEVQIDPTNVMLRGVGMSDLFSEAELYLDGFAGLDLIRAFNDRYVFLGFPVGSLDSVSKV